MKMILECRRPNIFSSSMKKAYQALFVHSFIYSIIANWIKYPSICICVSAYVCAYISVHKYIENERMTNLHDIQTRHITFSKYFMLDFISIVIHIHIFSWMTAMTKCKSSENICHKNEFCCLPKMRVSCAKRVCESKAPINTEVGGKVLSKRAEKLHPVYQTLDLNMRVWTFADRINCSFVRFTLTELNIENHFATFRFYSYGFECFSSWYSFSFVVIFFFHFQYPNYWTKLTLSLSISLPTLPIQLLFGSKWNELILNQ